MSKKDIETVKEWILAGAPPFGDMTAEEGEGGGSGLARRHRFAVVHELGFDATRCGIPTTAGNQDHGAGKGDGPQNSVHGSHLLKRWDQECEKGAARPPFGRATPYRLS